MLLVEGVAMRSFARRDWTFLISLCDADVRAAYTQRGEEGSPFTPLHMALRTHMDTYLHNYIETNWK